jgi:MFS family permease
VKLIRIFPDIGSPLYFVLAILGGFYTDTWGRRKQLGIATACFALIFIVLTPVIATNFVTDETGTVQAKSPSQAIAIILLIIIYGIVFALGYTPLQVLYPVECLHFETRAKGMGMLGVFGGISGFYNRFVTGIALTSLNWRYYFVFIFWNIAACVFIYFFYVETRRRTLEELTEIFRAQYPVRTSKAKSQIIIRGDEIIVHEVEKVM